MSIILLRRRGLKTELSTPVVSAHIALFVTCTVHYALEFNHFYTTLVRHLHLLALFGRTPIQTDDEQAARGVKGYANETTQLVGADIFLSLCDLLGDYILIYRCWVLWGRNYWIVALPSLCAVAGFGESRFVLHPSHRTTRIPSALAPHSSQTPH